MAVDVIYWPTPDPSAAVGSREEMLEGYRALRDTLMKRIKNKLGWRPMGSV
jgi:hypothetical protein